MFKRAGLSLALVLVCLFGAGPAWMPTAAMAQSASIAAGPMRAVMSPLGLMVGDYVGGSVVFVDPKTMAVSDTLPLRAEPDPADPDRILRTKPQGVAWMIVYDDVNLTCDIQVYVGDERTGAVQVYQKSGAIKERNGDCKVEENPKKDEIGQWELVSESLTVSPIGGPSDIAADESLGWLFVASQADRTVYVLDDTGAVLHTIGESTINRPHGVALDRAGQRVYVSDEGERNCGSFGSCSGIVRVYGYDGTFRGAISGRSGGENFNFSRPQGLDVDGFGRVYLVDSWRGQVLAFDEVDANSWAGVVTFGSKGPGIKQLLLPMDVIVDEQHSFAVYVTNSMQGRVEVFSFQDMVMVP